MADENSGGSMSGLQQNEAREFHAIFVTSFMIFTAIALVAHFLVYLWRPWFPGVDGYTMLNDSTETLSSVVTYFT